MERMFKEVDWGSLRLSNRFVLPPIKRACETPGGTVADWQRDGADHEDTGFKTHRGDKKWVRSFHAFSGAAEKDGKFLVLQLLSLHKN